MDSRAKFLAEARKTVGAQLAYFEAKAEAQWKLEQGQCRAIQSILELSRVDDEKLSPSDLKKSQTLRELSCHRLSHGARGPYITNAVTTIGADHEHHNELPSPSPSMQLSKSEKSRTKLPRDPYWRHLRVKRPEKVRAKDEPEDLTMVDDSRDAMSEITDLRKDMRTAPDPNFSALRIGQQYMRLVFGTAGPPTLEALELHRSRARSPDTSPPSPSHVKSVKSTAVMTPPRPPRSPANDLHGAGQSANRVAVRNVRLTPTSPESAASTSRAAAAADLLGSEHHSERLVTDTGGSGDMRNNKESQRGAQETSDIRLRRERREAQKAFLS